LTRHEGLREGTADHVLGEVAPSFVRVVAKKGKSAAEGEGAATRGGEA